MTARGTATARVVIEWAARMPVPLRHVWHPDRGFRLAEIRNRAIRASAGTYCVFLDGDCIARPDFVAAHRRLAEPGWFVTGNRILLSRELTERILRDGLEPERWGFASWITERAQRNVNRFAPLLDLPLGQSAQVPRPALARRARQQHGVLAQRPRQGRRLRRRLQRVGPRGFRHLHPLIRSGVLRKDGRFATGVLHLWHPEADRARLADNERLLADVLDSQRVRAKQDCRG